MDSNNIQRAKNVLATLFDISPDEINETSSPDTLPAWDSLGHMHLVVGLEEEFGIQLSVEQTLNMMNFELVCSTVQEAIDAK